MVEQLKTILSGFESKEASAINKGNNSESGDDIVAKWQVRILVSSSPFSNEYRSQFLISSITLKAVITKMDAISINNSILQENSAGKNSFVTKKRINCCAFYGTRWLISFLILFAGAVEYMCRFNINVSMVAMVKEMNHSEEETFDTCLVPSTDLNEEKEVVHGTYDWNAKTQGLILGSFFVTYVPMQIPCGRLAEVFGGKWIVSFSLLGSGILNVLTPHLTSSFALMITSRMTLGLLQCGLFPACFSIIFHWFPLKERSMAYSVMEIGTMLGNVWASAMAGYLAEHGFAGGWPSTFYISGVIAIISCAIWTPLVTSRPSRHCMITTKELSFIKDQDYQSSSIEASLRPEEKKKRKVPWKAIFTNKAVLANVFSKFFLRWTFYTLMMKLPTYLSDVLHMTPTKNGIVNASMYVASMVPVVFIGWFSEQLISKKWLTRTQCRKTFIGTAAVGSAICTACVPLMGCNASAVIALLLIGNIFQSLDAAGNIPNPGELSKNFGTTVFAFVNMLNCSIGFINPYFIGLILESGKGGDPMKTWSIVFYLASGLSLLAGVIYGFFGSGSRQPFDYVECEQQQDEKNNS